MLFLWKQTHHFQLMVYFSYIFFSVVVISSQLWWERLFHTTLVVVQVLTTVQRNRIEYRFVSLVKMFVRDCIHNIYDDMMCKLRRHKLVMFGSLAARWNDCWLGFCVSAVFFSPVTMTKPSNTEAAKRRRKKQQHIITSPDRLLF